MRTKIALAVLSLFAFVALPSIGRELHIDPLKKLDPLTWGSQIILATEDSEEDLHDEHHEDSHEKPEESVSEHHSVAGEHEKESEHPILEYLRETLGSAMDFK